MRNVSWTKAKKTFANIRPHVFGIPSLNRKDSVEVWVCDKSKHVDDWIQSKILDNVETCVGFDMEWRPGWHSERENKTALVQIATPYSALLIQMPYLDKVPDSFRELLASHKIAKSGFGVLDDLKKLQRENNLEYGSFIDLGFNATRFSLSDSRSLKAVAESVCGISLPKPKRIQMSNWESQQLTQEQITYAANDAIIGRLVFDRMCNIVPGSLFRTKNDFSYEQFFSGPSEQPSVDSEDMIPGSGSHLGMNKSPTMCGRKTLGRNYYRITSESSTATLAFVEFLLEADGRFVSELKSMNPAEFKWSEALREYCTRLGWELLLPRINVPSSVRESAFRATPFLSANSSSSTVFPLLPVAQNLTSEQREDLSRRLLEYLLSLQRLVDPAELFGHFSGRIERTPAPFLQHLRAVEKGEIPLALTCAM